MRSVFCLAKSHTQSLMLGAQSQNCYKTYITWSIKLYTSSTSIYHAIK
jgi:hypothetical protein